ncbi:MAG TPA: hypothetical protein VL326_07920 [Kofleriaceae bacterium]|jgi:hypothetical protein|nr:hypothetical protein [Kofleriaceae bacterium]
MRIWMVVVVMMLACSKKSAPPDPPPSKDPTPTPVAAIDAAPATLYQRDRNAACAAFADRFAPSMKGDTQSVDEAVTQRCLEDKRIAKSNYPCLIAAKSGDDMDACFQGSAATGARPTKAECQAYAAHVAELMAADLRNTATKMCTSEQMTEETYDCVMAAQDDATFKHCLGR